MITVVQPDEPFASDPTLLLALCIWREARGESLDAKIGVARTVINRCHTRGQGFAADISGNVLKPGAFSSFNEGDPNATKYPEHDDPSWRDSLKAAHDAGASDPILGAVFYYSPPLTAPPCKHDGTCAWGDVEHTATIGNLNFYRIA